jgi:uncharacterized protein
VPADLSSTLVLILVTAADTVVRLWPYVVGGILVAVVLSRATERWNCPSSPRLYWHLTTPGAVVAGAISPIPTMSMIPVVLQLRKRGLPAGPGLAFILASSLMNPQLFFLTLGALGVPFALAQLGAVLALSALLGLLLDPRQAVDITATDDRSGELPSLGTNMPILPLAGHVAFYFLVGVTAGAAFQVLLPRLGLLNWLGARGWLATPVLGWLAAPFYTCGGSAVPLARSLGQAGFSSGTLFAFLLAGPALRGTTLSSLGCLLPKRNVVTCLVILAGAAGLLGHCFDWLMRGI